MDSDHLEKLCKFRSNAYVRSTRDSLATETEDENSRGEAGQGACWHARAGVREATSLRGQQHKR